MHGILRPSQQPSRDGYSQVTSFDATPGHSYYGNSYQHPQQQEQQQHTPSQSHARPGVSNTPTGYYPSSATYDTPSTQYSNAYATPSQPASASHAAYQGYNSSTNTYNYADPSPSTAYVQQHAGASEEPISPESGRKEKTTYGLHHDAKADTLDDLMTLLQADIDASVVNGEHELTKSEISLTGSAFVPLMRPNIGPYADGGDQDLPAEFKANYPEKPTANKQTDKDGQSGESGERSQSQDQPQQDNDASQSEPAADSTQPQDAASTSQPQPTPSQPVLPEEPDPLLSCPNATVDCILNITDANIRAITQRAASRGLVQRIMNLDGFKYMFNNFWSSRVDNDGLRFSYICRDSLQNKDRHAHVPARASTTPPVHRQMFRKTKESWDCKGSVSIKFSSTVGAIVVQYRHAAVHPTHAERKRPPRKPAGQKSGRGVGRPRGSRGTKRKRDEFGVGGPPGLPLAASTPARFDPAPREPSLFELLQQSALESASKEGGGQLGDSQSPWWANS